MNRLRQPRLLPLLLLGSLLTGCAQAAPPPRPGPNLPLELVLPDVAGHSVQPLAAGTNRAIVCVFLANECPISNRAIPELRRLQDTFGPRGVAFRFVHPNADETDDAVRKHTAEYALPGPMLRDPGLKLAHLAGVEVTPTALVVSPAGEMLYRGRIDDRYAALGQAKPEPTRHDLERALTAVLGGQKPDPAETRAVGCHLVATP
jgi:hypothetical protein